MSMAPAPPSYLQRLQKRAFATPVDTVITLVVAAILCWLFWMMFDWGVLRAIWRAEDVDLCQDKAAGACWSIIDARHRLILFGLYPYDEHWRSTLACGAIIATVVLSCIPWFWATRRLITLWDVAPATIR